MLNKTMNLLSRILLREGKVTLLVKVVFVMLLLFPLSILMVFNYRETYRHMTSEVYKQNANIANFSEILVKERLDRLVNIAVALAGRPRLIEEIRKDNWGEAINYLKNVMIDFPVVLGVGLYDTKGVIKQGWPGFQKILGSDFSFRDWYKGISRKWEPYVSEVYIRRAEPQLNIVSIAVPIKEIDLAVSSGSTVSPQDRRQVLGILLLHIRLEVFSEWVKDLKLSFKEEIFLIDKKGQMIYHPAFPLQGRIRDFSNITSVGDFLKGREGTVVVRDLPGSEEKIATFRKVDKYNWGVIFNVPVKVAFADRFLRLRFVVLVHLIIGILTVFLAFLLLLIYEDRRRKEAEVKAINDLLAARNSDLELVNKELEAFSYSVSHDLRAPLRSIDGFSQALLEDCGGKLAPAEEGYLNRIRGACRHMSELIEDLLVLSRVSRSAIRKEKIDLGRLAGEVADLLRKNEPGRQVEFVISEGIIATADHNLINTVLENLLGNAWKFTRNSKLARIEFGREIIEGEPVYFVKDNGAGFDMAYVDKLFVPFQRLHSTFEFEGTGIGLASVRRIISRHGGKVWAEGAVGEGAKFYFTLC